MEDIEQSRTTERAQYTACLGVEGNGPNFSVHIGAYIALLEQNIIPKVTIGGSSGAVTGSFLMALLENPSLEDGFLKGEQVFLTRAQKAALILGVSDCVFDSFIFLPNFRNFRKTLINWFRNFLSHNYQDRLINNYETEVIDVKNTVGQVAAAVDFFKNTDFSKIIDEFNYTNRKQLFKHLWIEHFGAIETTIHGLIAALDKRLQLQHTDFEEEIIQRFWQLSHNYSTKAFQTQPDNQANLLPLQPRNLWVIKTALMVAKIIYKYATSKIFLSGKHTLNKIFRQKIVLLEPYTVLLGYQGFSKSGKFLEIPKRMVIHSTFRSGERSNSGLKENPGWESLYQGYFPASNLVHEFVKYRDESSSQKPGLLSFVQDGVTKSVIPPERILVLKQDLHQQTRGFSFALQATSSETGYFRRYPLQETCFDRDLNPQLPRYLFSFGGWLEKTPLSTLAHLPVGQQADYYVTLCRRDSVTWFTRKAFHAVLGQERQQKAKQLFNLMNHFVDYSISLTGRKGTIHVVFDNEWNNPVLNGNENFFVKDLLVGLLPNRKAHMLIGYLEVVRILREQLNYVEPEVLPWGFPVPPSLYAAGRKAKQEANQAFWSFLSHLE